MSGHAQLVRRQSANHRQRRVLLTLFGDEEARPRHAALVVRALQEAASEGRLARARIEEVDGERLAASGLEAAFLSAGAKLTPKGIVVEAPRA